LLTGAPDELDRFAQWMLAVEIDRVRMHESGHLADFRWLLPFGSHVLANVGVLWSHFVMNGFSVVAATARYETVAEVFAYTDARHPHVTLLSSLNWITDDRDSLGAAISRFWTGATLQDSPYYWTSYNILAAMAEQIAADPRRYPTIDARGNITLQLHRLAPDELRALVQTIADDYGVAR
jgi:hypothetical protein